jgi:hypothetical protein
MTRMLAKIKERFPDLVFLALVVICLVLALGGLHSELTKREASLATGGGRKVDVAKVRKQIIGGTLSPQKALFYRRQAE